LTPFPTRRSSDLHQGLSGRSQARSGSSGRTGGGRRSRCPAAGSRTHHRGRPHPVGRAIPPDAPGHLWRYWLTHLGPASCPRGLDSDAVSIGACIEPSASGTMKGIAANVITSRLAARAGCRRRAVCLLSTLPLAAGHDVPGQPFFKRPPGDPPGRADLEEGQLTPGHRLVQVAATYSSEPARLGNRHCATAHQLKLALPGHPEHLHTNTLACLMVRAHPCYTQIIREVSR